MTWSAYFIHTLTGSIGPKVETSGITWAIPLNGIETLKVTLRKAELPPLDKSHWLAPWWGGILLMWDETPIFAGPIIGRPTETFDTIDFDCSGIRSVLARRIVVQELFGGWGMLPYTTLSFTGMSLGTIAKRVVQAAQIKTGGRLPIEYPVPDQFPGSDADHERNYQGFDVQNLNCDTLLTNLSQVHNGPDIMFKPRLISEAQLVWDMWTGTENEPRIAQNQITVWDTIAVQSSVTDLSIVSTGAYMTDRVYSVGNGTDQGTLITVSEDLKNVRAGSPLLETSIAISKSSDPAVVQAHGDGTLEADADVIREIALTVRADGVYPLGSYWPGDLVEIYVKDWVTLPDGVHKCRLLAMSGDLFNNVKLNMQTEE